MSRDLINHARRLLAGPGPSVRPWPRLVALLARQALEEGLAYQWKYSRFPEMSEANWSTQLACLAESGLEDQLTSQVHTAWAGLSRACHHHHYELDPTAAELERWIRQTEAFLTEVHRTGDDQATNTTL